MLYVFKLNDKLKLYVNYQNLNVIIKKICYSFLNNQLLNRLIDVKLYTKLNIKSTYNALKIEKKRMKIHVLILLQSL